MAAQHGVDLGPEAAAVIADATKAVTTSAQDATRAREVYEASLERAFTAISRLLRERQQGVLVVVRIALQAVRPGGRAWHAALADDIKRPSTPRAKQCPGTASPSLRSRAVIALI
ncbi:hypothetical protein SAMN06264364_11787 [Quadrisphaera granulorum]|uniref:Uncharacterized protein n=2 Tax=Quadrisphaera granulorum TaxID=317664 RepID=A0A316A568_9ACTN|nr:hypothetical protein BXY45_11787 [Quadrisphaera granulorum]SZE97440.1 hypothetical protein SAMN06264364_11787 [Quadrisphaera granulorum]